MLSSSVAVLVIPFFIFIFIFFSKITRRTEIFWNCSFSFKCSYFIFFPCILTVVSQPLWCLISSIRSLRSNEETKLWLWSHLSHFNSFHITIITPALPELVCMRSEADFTALWLWLWLNDCHFFKGILILHCLFCVFHLFVHLSIYCLKDLCRVGRKILQSAHKVLILLSYKKIILFLVAKPLLQIGRYFVFFLLAMH